MKSTKKQEQEQEQAIKNHEASVKQMTDYLCRPIKEINK